MLNSDEEMDVVTCAVSGISRLQHHKAAGNASSIVCCPRESGRVTIAHE